MQMDDAVAKVLLSQQFQPGFLNLRKSRFPSTHQDRADEEMNFVNQPGTQRCGAQFGPSHGEVMIGVGLHVADGLGIKNALDPGP